jgi:hypothetical protein
VARGAGSTFQLAYTTLIGRIGGPIGLGGGEFRSSILVSLISFAARAAAPMNPILSLVTLAAVLVVRWRTGSLVGVGIFAPAVVAFSFRGITVAWFALRAEPRAAHPGISIIIARDSTKGAAQVAHVGGSIGRKPANRTTRLKDRASKRSGFGFDRVWVLPTSI